MMKYEQVLRHLDGFSGFLVFSVFLLGLVSTLICMENIANNFVSPTLDHWCYVTSLVDLSQETQRHLLAPDGKSENCHAYDIPWQNYSSDELESWDWSNVNVSEYQQIACQQGWVYDNSTFNKPTATSEWDLVCENEIIADVVSPVYLSGLLFGSMMTGPVSDRFGRLRSIMSFLSVHFLVGIVVTFAPNVWVYMIARNVLGATLRAASLGIHVVAAEMTVPRYRSNVSIIIRIMYVCGMLISALLAYFVRHFRVYQFVLIIPLVLIVPLLAWAFPESPRWLLSKGRVQDTEKAIHKLARRYRRTIPPEVIHEYAHQNVGNEKTNPTATDTKTRSRDLLFNPVVRRYTLIIGYGKVAAQFVYFAVSMNLGALVGDLYLNTLIAGAIEVPSLLLVLWMLVRFGRRFTVASCFLVASISGAISTACLLIDGAEVGATVTLIICRSAAGCAMSSVHAYTGELFPTPFRQSAVGLTSSMAAFVAIFAPIVGGPLIEVWPALPNIIFTVMVSIGVVLICLLPETLGQPLPETTQDAAALLTNSKSPCLPCLHPTEKMSTDKGTNRQTGMSDFKERHASQPVSVISSGDLNSEPQKDIANGNLIHLQANSDKAASLGEKASISSKNDLDGYTNDAFLPDPEMDYLSTRL